MSNEMQHTEGKWDVKNWADGAISIVMPISEKRFLGICQIECCDSRTEMEANAKLIAAAPEMLKTLLDVKEWMAINDPVKNGTHIRLINEIVKKATHAA